MGRTKLRPVAHLPTPRRAAAAGGPRISRMQQDQTRDCGGTDAVRSGSAATSSNEANNKMVAATTTPPPLVFPLFCRLFNSTAAAAVAGAGAAAAISGRQLLVSPAVVVGNIVARVLRASLPRVASSTTAAVALPCAPPCSAPLPSFSPATPQAEGPLRAAPPPQAGPRPPAPPPHPAQRQSPARRRPQPQRRSLRLQAAPQAACIWA